MNDVSTFPPLTRVEQFNCANCATWIDPATTINRPYFAPGNTFGRYLYLECEHCKRAVVFALAWGGASWSVQQVHQVPAGDLSACKAALLRDDGPTAPAAAKYLLTAVASNTPLQPGGSCG